MIPPCPKCQRAVFNLSGFQNVVRFGSFYRRSDSKRVRRFRCLACKKGFSQATLTPCYRQKKRHKNYRIAHLFTSAVSQRQIARLENVDRKTVARKLVFLGAKYRELNLIENSLKSPAQVIEFDDLETHEHSKCKPLSVTLAVVFPSRRVLGFRVSQMPAKGLLSKISIKKYGYRKDLRREGRTALFQEIKPLILEDAMIKSDENPAYIADVKTHFPKATHLSFRGKRGAITGQGELKKVGFDPLFRLNHTCAMFRAHVATLIRRTWNTTKKPDRLSDRMAIYQYFHNRALKSALAAGSRIV